MSFETHEDVQNLSEENALLEKLKEKLMDLELLLFLPTSTKKKINAWIQYRSNKLITDFSYVNDRSSPLKPKDEITLMQIRRLFISLVQSLQIDTILAIFSKRERYRMLLKKKKCQHIDQDLKSHLTNIKITIEKLLTELESDFFTENVINLLDDLIREMKLLRKCKKIYDKCRNKHPLNSPIIQNFHKRICSISGRKKLNNRLLKEYLLTLKTYLEIEQALKIMHSTEQPSEDFLEKSLELEQKTNVH